MFEKTSRITYIFRYVMGEKTTCDIYGFPTGGLAEILRALKQFMPSAAKNYILFRKFLACL